ncbi:Glycoside hydrolase family 44 [Fibrobacter sp. UWH9]|uniref:glycoside hydrolase family 44 protein n=1 Tax=Fibrobacter sp. UWH9 TaxID=1896213 RepID=UPI00091F79D1|nr:glycoside hydrolase family 44 protein [Fibrobacter sp. UWH9]SHH82071.1 Glycoside hydrolase family 44 [Fibrobacter sp. UWH9]
MKKLFGFAGSLVPALSLVAFLGTSAQAEISVMVDASAGVKKISPYLYGRNIDKVSADSARLSDEDKTSINTMNEAGIRFIRANYGNNSTRYNWRKKLTVHPDWYNNVNAVDWDITAKKILDNMPQADAMYAFQLTGYAAATNEYNFADWTFYKAHNDTWAKATLDLAGGGEVADDGETLIKAGDYSLYCEPWPADSTVGIIDHWAKELKYDMSRLQYWSMDNEMEIWNGTHGDLPLDMDPDFLVERYVDVAKKARTVWPEIKLTGPVVANEWQWCTTGASEGKSGLGKGEDRNYCWLEYFIKRLAEEQKKSGVRMLDVFDMHWYPSEKTYAERVNWHRVFFDTTYNYSGANGIKLVSGKWDNNQTKEYIFERVNGWLDQYFGKGHGITLGLTETSIIDEKDPMTTAISYASWLGTFMDHGVEIFTPWTWGDGMYEVLHLFSRYNGEFRVQSESSNDSLLSAYSSVSNARDSMTVILVNRAEKDAQSVSLNVKGLKNVGASAETLTLTEISGETFVSHESNALKMGTATVSAAVDGAGTVALEVPAKSIVAVRLTADAGEVIEAIAKPIVRNDRRHNNLPMIFRDDYQIKVRGGEHFDNKIFRVNGKVVK